MLLTNDAAKRDEVSVSRDDVDHRATRSLRELDGQSCSEIQHELFKTAFVFLGRQIEDRATQREVVAC